MKDLTANILLKNRLDRIYTQLETERSSFDSHWRELSDYILPRRSRFFVTDANKGSKKSQNIIDSTATMSARTLASGMMAGVTSPARPWFRLAPGTPDLGEIIAVKEWLRKVEDRMRGAFVKSNLYNVLPTLYGDIGTFGTGCIFMEEDMDMIFRFYSLPVGSYFLGLDDKGRPRVFVRRFQMTVRQIVEKFGMVEGSKEIDWTNISEQVKSNWKAGTKEAWVQVRHVITKNPDFDPNAIGPKSKPYMSVYYERGESGSTGSNLNSDTGGGDGKILRKSGYDFFPVLAPRWETTGEDVYGTNCPGMIALGDVKQLQIAEKRGLQAIEKMVNPPMVGHSSLRNAKVSILPGDITYVDDRDGRSGFRPAHEVRFDINALEMKQQQVRQRVSKAFYEDLFLMLANSDRRQITAREIEERHEEKLLALGPVLEQLNQDLLDPLIDNAFIIMLRRGMIPEAPEELQGDDLKVEYISIMAQAQKLAGIGNIERFSAFVGQMSGLSQDALDKIDTDAAIDNYGELVGVPNEVIRNKDEVEAIRQQRQQALAQQQQMQNAAQAIDAAKQLSSTSTAEGNALSDILT